MTDSISLNNGEVWDDPEYVIPIGFDFDFFGFTTDSFYMEAGLGGILSPGTFNEDIQPLFVVYGSDVIDIGDTSSTGVSVSELSYKIEGSAGNRITKIEWKNVGFYNEVSDAGTANNYLSFQLWLFEANGDIEIHFGPNSIEDDELVHDGIGPLIGMINEYDTDLDDFSEFWFLAGDQNNPVLDTIFSVDDININFSGLDDDPLAGTIYRFSTSPPLSVNRPLIDEKVSVYPALARDVVNVQIIDTDLKNARLQLFDASGQLLLRQNIFSDFTSLNIQDLVSGMYFIHISTAEGLITRKIVKK